MQRYFFNFFDGVQWSHDYVGQQLNDISEIRKEARLALVEMSENYIMAPDGITLFFEVIDEEGSRVCTVQLSLHETVFAPGADISS